MSDLPGNAAYTKRFDAVLAYIDANLEGDLSVKTLSQVAHFSAFHFHRQFTAFVGMPVARYVQLMRLRRAAHGLSSRADYSVLEAALGAGFESPEAFSRAFRRAFGMAPSAFRKRPNWQVWRAVFSVPHFSRSIIMQVRIVEFHSVRVAAFEHRGDPGLVDESVQTFIAWRMQSGQSPVASSRSFGIPFGNPDTTPADEFRFAICGEIDEVLAANEFGITERVIPGGRCVVVRHVGSPDHIAESIYPIYRDWLPGSGEELRDQSLFFEYLSISPETPQDQWQTDIYVPLQ
ncbi:AraC family transcriptional regulator [Pseudomonas sp. JAI120]|uniref:AraC family transcriptional regulator n=1 Tax=Pseudomonas sp. JAI120 TaxID=2723063 RepID=UPI0030D79B93